MVFVRSDGTVSQSPPIHEQFFRFIFGIFFAITFFFKSLVGMETNKRSTSRNSSGGNSFFGGGGGGGGGDGRPFGPNGRGPNIRTMRDINPPVVRGGGCPGGSCGM